MPLQSAIWVAREEAALLDFLVAHVAEAGDGGNFKKATFERALNTVSSYHERGPVKTVRMLQNKYTALKKIFRVVEALQRVSGWTWSDTDGCGITPESADSWDAYVKHHPEAKPFRNCGWCHTQRFEFLIPPSVARGANVIYPSQPQGTHGAEESDNEEDHDVEIEASSSQLSATASNSPSATPGPPNTPSPPQRVRPKSGAAAIADMAASVTKFGDAVAAALAPPSDSVPPTPRRRIDAITAFSENERQRLSQTDFFTMLDIFRKDTTACDIYTIFADKKDIREDWIEAQLLQVVLKASSII
ncbi:hypothetical protein BKA70DRAFT_1435428 [Coprinopsis sp. MPI-PUGE-AT-0042]|nr:hypothetical protein BKA70DRAFT_1435428 [Coprinopsis sp. MPI-PUGE-AT-0042]